MFFFFLKKKRTKYHKTPEMLWLDGFLCLLLGQMGYSADWSLEGVEDSAFSCGLWLS